MIRGDRQRLPSWDETQYIQLDTLDSTDIDDTDVPDLTDRTVDLSLVTKSRNGDRIALTNAVEIGDPTAGEVAITLEEDDTAVPINGIRTHLYGEFRISGGTEDPTTAGTIKIELYPSRHDIEAEAGLFPYVDEFAEWAVDGTMDAAGARISTLADPTAEQDAVNQRTLSAGLSSKADSDGGGTATLDAYAAIGTASLNNIRYVSSAAETNAALQELSTAGTGGHIRWIPGEYTGDSFTEMIDIPVDGYHYTLDFRGVSIDIAGTDPYRGEDGAYIYKGPSADVAGVGGSQRINIHGPEPLQVRGTFSTKPNIIELYDTTDCRIDPHIIANNADRLLFFRQSDGNGHQVSTRGYRAFGGNVCLQVGSDTDITGKDRSFFYGQLAGWDEAGILLEGDTIHNRIYAQGERPGDNAVVDNSGVRVLSSQNIIMMTHIDAGHPVDIQARNCGISAPATPGNPYPFHKSRLGIRPSNIDMPNYSSSIFNFSTNYLPVLGTEETGSATVTYDGTRGLVELAASDQRATDEAVLQSAGPAGQLDHHIHSYADIELETKSGKVLRFGAHADSNNYAMLRQDSSETDNLHVDIVVGGVTEVSTPVKSIASADRVGWLVFIRDNYQAFYHDFELVHEAEVDLSTWTEPRVRADLTRPGGTGAITALVRQLEYGLAKKQETA